MEQQEGTRINKFLSEAGVCSRREADRALEAGQIRIGDRVVDSSIRTKLDGLTKQLLQIQLG